VDDQFQSHQSGGRVNLDDAHHPISARDLDRQIIAPWRQTGQVKLGLECLRGTDAHPHLVCGVAVQVQIVRFVHHLYGDRLFEHVLDDRVLLVDGHDPDDSRQSQSQYP